MMRGLVLSGLVAITASCAPFGEGALGGAASSESFSSAGAPVPVGPPDQQAQELLMMASSNATVASFDSGTFANIDVEALTSMDPSLRFAGDVPTRVGVVSINLASKNGLVMSTESTSGRSFCVSVTGASLASFSPPQGGTVDAHGASSPGDCTGRDWVSNP
jgi:hypothetical protein